MAQLNLWQKMIRRENPSNYADKDGKLQPILGKKEMIAMGIGTVVGAGVFTMPGIVAAECWSGSCDFFYYRSIDCWVISFSLFRISFSDAFCRFDLFLGKCYFR